jgi:hypothetical protein
MKWARLFLSLYRYEEMFLEAQHKAVPVGTLVLVREPKPNAMDDAESQHEGLRTKGLAGSVKAQLKAALVFKSDQPKPIED